MGEAGRGKSMLVRHITAELSAEGWRTSLILCSGGADLAPDIVSGTVTGPGRALLVVDDAHLLDGDSAETLWRVAGSDAACVIATIRAGERVPDRVARLWTGGSCERMDLSPLTAADIHLLLEQVLGGDVEDRLPRQLSQRAGGNALLVRELIRGCLEAGSLVHSHHLWRLSGELPVGNGVADLIRVALADLTEQELTASQLLALGEPMQLRLADALIDGALLEALDSKRVALVQDSVDGPVLTLAHPLYGEVIRADLSPIRSRRLRLQLIRAVDHTSYACDRDVLRSATWRLELREPIGADELLHAARLARSIAGSTAELLARAAMVATGAPGAVVLLADILLMQGRIAEADRLLDEVDLDAIEETEREHVTSARALGRTRLGEVAEAAAILTSSGTGKSSLQLQAIHAQALMLDGRLDQAAAVARPVFADDTADRSARAFAAFTLVAGATFAGQVSEAEPVLRAALPLAAATRAAVPYGVATVQVSAVITMATAGRLADAQKLAEDMYDESLREDDEWLRPRGASGLGVVALMRGQVRTATKYFRITVASLNEFDGLFLRYNLSYLARAAALAGFRNEARQALSPPPDAPQFPIFQADWQIAEAAVLATAGDLDAAVQQAVRAARTAARLGAWAPALFAAHDAVRYGGGPAATELVITAAEQVDAALPRVLGEHAAARSTNDPARLVEVSQRFERLGCVLYAAEAGYAAARAYRGMGDGRAAARAGNRAAALHARCEGAVIDWISAFPTVGLTRREQQIALLAAAGHPDATIAAQLGISRRTVQTHLVRVYRKLDITGRRDLPDVLIERDHRSG
ncbi:MAG: LuxR C-terminal-related transcriptional regulator [Nakamurella sp.]